MLDVGQNRLPSNGDDRSADILAGVLLQTLQEAKEPDDAFQLLNVSMRAIK
jgi:hypothetical protein